MTTIAEHQELVTLINVFRVAPKRQQALLDLLTEATEEVMCELPGFISANRHRGLDGTHVANYAQWRSRQEFEVMLRHPAAQVHMRAAAAMAEAAPTPYAVASVHHAAPAARAGA